MKNLVYILSILLFLGCQKEDDLIPSIQYEHLYGIANDATDSVGRRVYEIYQKYGVPVYFNDTIGRVFVKKDIYGDSVFNYETLDLSWEFTADSKVQFRYEYMEDQEKKLSVLDLIESYLALCPKALYPFNFFVVKSANSVDAAGNVSSYGDSKEYAILFRTLLLMSDEDLSEDLPYDLRLAMIKQKISNYPTELEMFNDVCESSWFYVAWTNLDPNFYEYFSYPHSKEYQFDFAINYEYYYQMGWFPITAVSIPAGFMSSDLFTENYGNASRFLNEEGLEKFRAMVREKIGAWGFITPGGFTPMNADADLNAYLNEMLSTSKQEFEKRWGSCPLVMEKYNLLYSIVAEKFGVKL